MRSFTFGRFIPLDPDQVVGLNGKSRVTVRSEAASSAFWSGDKSFDFEFLLGGGAIEYEVNAFGGFLRVVSSGRVWVDFHVADQRVERLDQAIFTTLDRPAPLSPEMAAIQRIMRRNEIDRERDRQAMLEFMNERDLRESQVVDSNDDADVPHSRDVSKGSGSGAGKAKSKRAKPPGPDSSLSESSETATATADGSESGSGSSTSSSSSGETTP